MLEYLYGEMERRESSRRGGYTRMLEYAWKGVAVVFIVFCASWLLIPGNRLVAKYDALNVKSPSAAEQVNQADYYCGESLDFKLYELGRNIESSISDVAELVDKDLTGF